MTSAVLSSGAVRKYDICDSRIAYIDESKACIRSEANHSNDTVTIVPCDGYVLQVSEGYVRGSAVQVVSARLEHVLRRAGAILRLEGVAEAPARLAGARAVQTGCAVVTFPQGPRRWCGCSQTIQMAQL